LRNQLNDTKHRLNEVTSENDQLRTLFTKQDVICLIETNYPLSFQITHLRRCLHVAEADIVNQQNEMNLLYKQFDSPPQRTVQAVDSL
jgi:regulator of replication initiation timing